MKDIVERTGVSRSSISMYLNHDARLRLSKEKQHLIDDVVQELGYRPSPTACALRKGRLNMLGLVLGGITNAYFSHLAEACMYFGERRGYQLLISLTSWGEDREHKALESLLDRQVDGIYYSPQMEKDPVFWQKIQSYHTPILVNGQPIPGFLSLDNGDQSAHKEVLKYFHSCGHTHVGYLVYSTHTRDGFLECCARLGLQGECFSFTDTNTLNEQLTRLLESRPTAIYVADCQNARKLLRLTAKLTPEYHPAVVTRYNLSIDYVEESGIVGYVFGNFYQHAKRSIDFLVDTIEGKATSPDPLAQHFYPIEDFLKARSYLIDSLEKAIQKEQSSRPLEAFPNHMKGEEQ
ncbi:MAG: LacI family DNA-binding transcriptional regulator [Victivallales bacterium]|nr:LacI family DNA-binding transcriptional regulator [Victivallales bacterium]